MVKDARRLQLRVGDGLWLRLIDVGGALKRRSYEGEGSIVIEVVDAFCPANDGRSVLAQTLGRRTPSLSCGSQRRPRLRVSRGFSFERLGAAAGSRSSRTVRSPGRRRSLAPTAAVLQRALLVAVTVRLCKSVAEFHEAVGAISEYGAWEITDEVAERFLRCHPLERMHAAFEGKRAVGGAGAFPLELSVPGGTVPCAGVTVVGVYPTHRRRGTDVDDASAARRRSCGR